MPLTNICLGVCLLLGCGCFLTRILFGRRLWFTARTCCPQGHSLHRACHCCCPRPSLPSCCWRRHVNSLRQTRLILLVRAGHGERAVVSEQDCGRPWVLCRGGQTSSWRQWGATEEFLARRTIWSDLWRRTTLAGRMNEGEGCREEKEAERPVRKTLRSFR